MMHACLWLLSCQRLHILSEAYMSIMLERGCSPRLAPRMVIGVLPGVTTRFTSP